MANIDVVPKKSGAGWMMWLLVAVAALVIVWLLMRSGAGQTTELDDASGMLVESIAFTTRV